MQKKKKKNFFGAFQLYTDGKSLENFLLDVKYLQYFFFNVHNKGDMKEDGRICEKKFR